MPNFLSRFLLSLLMALTVSGYVFSSETPSNIPVLKVDHYNVPEGLSQSTVTSIVEDDQGYIWIGTLNGLTELNRIFKRL